MFLSDPLPDPQDGENSEFSTRRALEADRPDEQLIQFGRFYAKRALEVGVIGGNIRRFVDFRPDEVFKLTEGFFEDPFGTPPIYHFKPDVHFRIIEDALANVSLATQERLQVERAISYYNEVTLPEESPYPNMYRSNPDMISSGMIPDTIPALVNFLIEEVYHREDFSRDLMFAATIKLYRVVRTTKPRLEARFGITQGRDLSIEAILTLARIPISAPGIFDDLRTRPPEHRYKVLDELKDEINNPKRRSSLLRQEQTLSLIRT